MSDCDDIHRFWFGTATSDAAIAKAQAALWWEKSAAVDADMRERFQALVEAVGCGAHRDWAETARGALALILLTDQFPRNIFRETPRAFAFDAQALEFACTLFARGLDRQLRPIERVFCYLPFEHSEALADQDRAVELFKQLWSEVAPAEKAPFANYLDFAERHRQVVERFGRFPHRNRILGRASTALEQAFLRGPGSSF
jgi:uncharacterized protein (DUF924 family)